MSNFNYLDYKGHSTFRFQPNHSYFDKPFEDENDCLFQCLHEIEPHFLKPEHRVDNLNAKNFIVIDPRTRKPITNLYYDHTQEDKTKIFDSPKRSMMTEKQHELGVRVLNALQLGLQIEDEDMYDWHRLESIRMKEKLYFLKFVFEFSQTNKEKMFAPCRKLLELYQKWYKSKALKLMKKYPQQTYNTHLGLPQVRQCKNALKELHVQLTNPEVVSELGEQCRWQDNMDKEFKKFNHSIESYSQLYINSEDLKDCMEDNFKIEFNKIAEQKNFEITKFYIPLESILFLLTAGDYIDMPTEMLLNIKESKQTESDFNKYIIMDQPLPSRQGGWHTYQQIVEQCALAVVSIQQMPDIVNKQDESPINNYRVFTVDDFLQKTSMEPDKLCKFSKTLIKWKLTTSDDDALEIYTSLDTFIENKDLSLKLEYKPRFGCEILTKYELLKQWFRFKLLKSSKSNCLRIDVTNFQTLLEENLDSNKLEEILYTNYHINCQQLLNNLFEFLKMLHNMPLGHYMLRFNPKFKDKLMLCIPSQEITPNTLYLHQLLQTDITDIEFMSQQDFLPIDANLCSLMHLQHNILPAAFSPRSVVVERVFHNQQKFIPKQKKTIAKAKEVKKPAMNRSKMKRIRKRQRFIEQFKVKRDEQKELDREIKLERKMLGN